MIYELKHAPFPDGYAEELLPLDLCKLHISVEDDTDDVLIQSFRDAAIDFVQGYARAWLGPVEDLVWQAESFPGKSAEALYLGVEPVEAITAISWRDSAGELVTGETSDFRLSLNGRVLPAFGKSWPSDVGGAVSITFDAGFADGEAPPRLVEAVRKFLGHLWLNREAVGASGLVEVPLGITALCAKSREIFI